MKLLILSDIHGNVKDLEKLEGEFKTCDAVLFAGDFAECFKTETAKPVLEELCKRHENIFAVLGNCDDPDFSEDLDNADINCEASLNFYEGLCICGSGGGSIFTGKTANERTEEDLLSDFDILKSENISNLILISHNPPKDACDSVNETLHAGSAIFTKLIEDVKPMLVVCGHIHEGAGTAKIGDTLVVNPGSFGESGSYAVAELSKKDGEYNLVSCEMKRI
ncbi:MAG: metallophosphoesterase family protein [Treponema sp.]|nr:metallophosphoesterase family protein [Treponema sp.]